MTIFIAAIKNLKYWIAHIQFYMKTRIRGNQDGFALNYITIEVNFFSLEILCFYQAAYVYGVFLYTSLLAG